MATLGRILGLTAVGLVGVGTIVGAGGYLYVSSAFAAARALTYEVHEADFPVPWPLSEAEVEALRAEKLAEIELAAATADVVLTSIEEGTHDVPPATDVLEGVDLGAIALERAKERGKHLVEARYACAACHGMDYSGGVMVDDPAMGTWLGRNLTPGAGSVTSGYTTADWDRIIRHGVRPDRTSAVMPSDDFTLMSDQELSDVIAYMTSLPAVDNEVPEPVYGPLYTTLVVVGELDTSADRIDHGQAHPTLPPTTAPTADFGAHLAGVCFGCHRPRLDGGKIDIGPPDWPPAANLTASNERLHSWTFEQFDTFMRTGVRPDGSRALAPMSDILPVAQNNTDTEMRALYAYLMSLEARPTGK